MSLPVSPPARRVFAVMVFGGAAHPRLIGNARLLQDPLLLVAVEVIRRWSRKTSRVVSSRHPPKCGTNDSDRQCSFSQSRFLLPSGCLLPNLRTENASGRKISIRAGGARIRTMARSTRRRAITRASLAVAPAFEVVAQQEEMPPLCSIRLELPLSSTYADGAAVLIATLADQTSLTWPDEFPRKSKRTEKPGSRLASVRTRFEFRLRI
jgi:hypothetical protein